MMTAANIQYELADRVQGLSAGGIGVMLLLARRIGLISDIDAKLQLLKIHLPYHESDHVLNIAFNILGSNISNCGATMKSISMLWEPTGSPTPLRRGTSVVAFVSPMS
jgi:hypothetical protein